MSASNSGRRIVTSGSGHMGVASMMPDICFKQEKANPAPFENYNPSTHLQKGTTKTRIGGASIWTEHGHLGTPSLPTHDGLKGGIISGTYCDQTLPVTCSPNLSIEGGRVVRSSDYTFQNAGNTLGTITEMTEAQKLEMQEDLLDGLDKVVAIEGICTHGRLLDVPRGGQRTGELTYLEILNEDTVVFRSTRINAFTNGAQECRRGGHAKWVATRSGLKPVTVIGDLFTLPGSFTDVPFFPKSEEWQKEEAELALKAQSFEAETYASNAEYDAAMEKERLAGQTEKPSTLSWSDAVGMTPFNFANWPWEDIQHEELKGLGGDVHDADDAGFWSWKDGLKGRELKNYQQEEQDKIEPVPDPDPVADPKKPERRRPVRGQKAQNIWDNEYAAYKQKLEKAQKERDRRAADAAAEKARRLDEANRTAQTRFEDERKRRQDRRKGIASRTAAIETAVTAMKNFDLLAKLLNAATNPPEIQVTATACSGAKTANIKVFPAGTHTFDLFSDALSTLLEAFNKLPKLLKSFGETLTLEVVVEALVDPRLMLSVEYKELLADGENGLKMGCVHPRLELDISFEKMLYCFFEIGVTFSRIFAANPPLSGILWLLEECGIAKGTVFFKVEFVLNPTWTGIRTEYDEYTWAWEMEFKIELQLGAKIEWGDLNEIGVALFTEFAWTFDDARFTAEKWAEFYYQGKGEAGIKGWAHVDVFGVWRENIDSAWVVAEADLGQGWWAPCCMFD
jgi:hypothetical protein